MKLLIKSVICAFLIAAVLSMTGFYGVCNALEDDVFRLHILANSDSQADQALKLKVRDALLDYTAELFQQCQSKDESMQVAKEHLGEIQNYAQQLVREYGYDYGVKAYVVKMPFNTRVYEDFTLPAGEYDALRIVIGSGKGHNWWCVLYPALCISSAEGNRLDEVMSDGEKEVITDQPKYEVRFKFVEIFEGLCSFFR